MGFTKCSQMGESTVISLPSIFPLVPLPLPPYLYGFYFTFVKKCCVFRSRKFKRINVELFDFPWYCGLFSFSLSFSL